MLSTWPRNSAQDRRPRSTSPVAPGRISASCVSLKFAVTQTVAARARAASAHLHIVARLDRFVGNPSGRGRGDLRIGFRKFGLLSFASACATSASAALTCACADPPAFSDSFNRPRLRPFVSFSNPGSPPMISCHRRMLVVLFRNRAAGDQFLLRTRSPRTFRVSAAAASALAAAAS